MEEMSDFALVLLEPKLRHELRQTVYLNYILDFQFIVQLLASNINLAQTLQIASVPMTVIILGLVVLFEAAEAHVVEEIHA